MCLRQRGLLAFSVRVYGIGGAARLPGFWSARLG